MDNKKKGIKPEDEQNFENLTVEEYHKILEEAEHELSDKEYEIKNRSKVKFVAPPKTHKELLKTLSETDSRYEAMKKILEGKSLSTEEKAEEERQLTQKDLTSRLPPNFLVSNLYYPKTQSDIILCGVENRSFMHASMVSDLLMNYNPSLIFTQISPDEPYFIRKPKNVTDYSFEITKHGLDKYMDDNLRGYKAYWRAFITQKHEASFHVNPGPHYLIDTMLLKNKNTQIIDENLSPCTKTFDFSANIAYSKPDDLQEKELLPDCFLTTLVHQYNNLDSNVQLVIGGYPILAMRDQVVRNYEHDELYAHFQTMLEQFRKNNLTFDPQYLMVDHCINPQAEYMAEVLRQSCYSSRRIVAVVDREMVPYIENFWKSLPKQRKLVDLYKSIPSFNDETSKTKKPYVEYIQKHTLVDVMFNSFIADHFMKYDYFPFNGIGLFGWENSIVNTKEFWAHYYNKYMAELNALYIDEDDYQKFKKDLKYQEDPVETIKKTFSGFPSA